MPRQTEIQRRINKNYGSRKNMNGAGAGGRLVSRRDRRTGRAQAGVSQLGSRRQRYSDIRVSFGLSGG